MIIFRPVTNNRFTCIPREYATSAVIVLRDDSTNVLVKYALVPRVEGFGNISINKDTYVIYNDNYENLVEGHFYDLTLYSDVDKTIVIYKDRIFCTAQKDDIDTDDGFYKLNKDQFETYDGFNNDYIVI